MRTQDNIPIKYEDLTPEQLVAITNGCGGKGGKVVPPYAAMFKADCDHHDYGYWKGGTWKDRLACDVNFLGSLLKDSFGFGWKRPVKVAYFSGWSLLYFTGVRLMGWKYFKYSKTKRYPIPSTEVTV
jgi:hypothetical protein